MEVILVSNQKPETNIPHIYHIYVYITFVYIYHIYMQITYIVQLSSLKIKESRDAKPNEQRSIFGPRTPSLPENNANYHKHKYQIQIITNTNIIAFLKKFAFLRMGEITTSIICQSGSSPIQDGHGSQSYQATQLVFSVTQTQGAAQCICSSFLTV